MGKVAVVLTQGFADWEYALLAGTGGPFYGFDIRYFAPEAGQVRSLGRSDSDSSSGGSLYFRVVRGRSGCCRWKCLGVR